MVLLQQVRAMASTLPVRWIRPDALSWLWPYVPPKLPRAGPDEVGQRPGKGVIRMVSDIEPRCALCHKTMSQVDFDLVPIDMICQTSILAMYTRCDNTIGWYWCAECNSYSHLPTIEWLDRKAQV